MKGKAGSGVSKGRGVEHAYRILRREIVSLVLRPGSALDEAALAARLGLSRTPVHEALVRLAAEQLVVLEPNRGASVAGMDWDEIREFIEAFELEQRIVTRWAALRRQDEQLEPIEAECDRFQRLAGEGDIEAMNESNWRFHSLIADACGNRLVARSYRHLLTLALRIAFLAYEPSCFVSPDAHRQHMAIVLREHREIVAALRERDADAAEALGRSHTHLARSRIVDTLSRGLAGGLEVAAGP